jgi:hypothetical protein
MRTRLASLAILAVCAACAALRGRPAAPPLGSDAELHVYLLPLPRDAERLSFRIESISARRLDGSEVPLELELPEVRGGRSGDQRLLAWGRVAPGEYAGIAVKISSAEVGQDSQRSKLLVDPEPVRAEVTVRPLPGRASVVWLGLRASPVRSDFSFAPRFDAQVAPQTPPRAALYCTNGGSASVTAVDRLARRVTGVVPVPGTPRGIALDAAAARAYVALHDEDRIEVVDVAVGLRVGSIRLLPGDGPGELGLAADGTLVVVNQRSRTVAFIDAGSLSELGRVAVGDDPVALLLDRQGRRAFVVNRASSSVTYLDVGNRAVLGTLPTDPEPLRAQLSRDGSVLYVVHRGSQYLATFAVPSLVPQARVFIGLGATTVRVDPRSELIYVSRGAERRIAVHDPLSLQEIDSFEMPGAVSYMAIDDAENTLLAIVPERSSIAVLDLTSRARLGEIPVGVAPYTLALFGERL